MQLQYKETRALRTRLIQSLVTGVIVAPGNEKRGEIPAVSSYGTRVSRPVHDALRSEILDHLRGQLPLGNRKEMHRQERRWDLNLHSPDINQKYFCINASTTQNPRRSASPSPGRIWRSSL